MLLAFTASSKIVSINWRSLGAFEDIIDNYYLLTLASPLYLAVMLAEGGASRRVEPLDASIVVMAVSVLVITCVCVCVCARVRMRGSGGLSVCTCYTYCISKVFHITHTKMELQIIMI